MKEALLYKKKDGAVQCVACSHRCVLKPGESGICGVRENQGGVLMSLVYGKAIALHVDPIEKKPLYHFLPGSGALSVAAVGCNMRCLYCQNADISQMPRDGRVEGRAILPEALVSEAMNQSCRIIAYTYTEPVVFFEYAQDTAVLARAESIRNVFVTNGYFTPESLAATAGWLDAANVDLKAFRDKTYKKICGARLEPVLDAIRTMRKMGIWVEVTTLLVPDLNDSDEELRDIAGFIAETDPEMPWHVSRFFPTYRMTDRPPTPIESIEKACRIGRDAGVKHVYAGNMRDPYWESTRCAACGELLIRRSGFAVVENRLKNGCCPSCGHAAAGVWQ